jgi:hypothetical protein
MHRTRVKPLFASRFYGQEKGVALVALSGNFGLNLGVDWTTINDDFRDHRDRRCLLLSKHCARKEHDPNH